MKSLLVYTLLFFAFLVLLLVVPTPNGGRVLSSAGDMLHAALFATCAILVYALARKWLTLPKLITMLACWGLVVLFGLATEALQSLVGRDASWHDLWIDACGGLAGILWVESRVAKTRGVRVAMFAAGCVVLLVGVSGPLSVFADALRQRFEMPQLASFEHGLEMSRWQWRECRVARAEAHATHGQWSLRADLESGRYPGVALVHPVADWSGFRELVIDVHLTQGPPLDLVVKIEDQEHNKQHEDRFHQIAHLRTGANQVRIALSDVAGAPRGEMDLRRIARLSLFAVSPDQQRTLHLDNIRLE